MAWLFSSRETLSNLLRRADVAAQGGFLTGMDSIDAGDGGVETRGERQMEGSSL